MSAKSYSAKRTQKTKTALLVKNKKSSVRARRLIEGALKKYDTERRAAKALHLPNHGQLHRMLIGAIYDTPAMKVELARRQRRAERAKEKIFYSFDQDNSKTIDAVATLRAASRALKQADKMIDEIMQGIT